MGGLLLFSIVAIVFLIIQLLRLLFFHIIKNKIGALFKDSFAFEPGKTWFSIKKLQGSSELGSLDIENFYIIFNPFNFLTKKKYAFFQLTADKLKVSLNTSKIKRKVETEPFPIEQWISLHILTYLLTFFVRTISVVIQNFSIDINGLSINISFFMFQFLRHSTDLQSILKFLKISVSYKGDTIGTIPRISMHLNSTVHIVPYILTLNFQSLNFNNEMFTVDYNNYELFINFRTFNIFVHDDPDVVCTLIIDPINANIVKTNLFTKSLSLCATSINGSLRRLSTGLITAKGNNCPIGVIQYASFQKFVLNLSPCEISLSLPLIIDFSLIARKINPKFADKPNPPLMKKLIINSPKIIANVNLSDAHRFQFVADSPRLKNMTLYTKLITCDIVFPDAKHQLLNGTFAQLTFSKPVFNLKTENAHFYLTPMFEEADFLRELFEIFLYIQKQVRGVTQTDLDLESPMRRVMGIEAKHAKFAFRHFPLALRITRANEARRIAVEGLLLRQAKAVNILEARNSTKFNEEEFDRKSREICFNLYREALKAIKPAENYLYKAEGEKVSVFLNGPDIPNKKEAVKILTEKFPNVANEDIGKVTGGPLKISAKYVAFQLQNMGDVIRFEEVDLAGHFFGVKRRPTGINDYYINKIFCDEGKTEIEMPLLSTRAVAFIDLQGTMDKAYSKSTPSILEFFQDSKIATTIMRRLKYKYFKLSFFDACRIRFQVNWDFQVKEVNYGYNDTLRAFKLDDYALACLPDCHFRLVNSEFLATAPELIVKVLTLRGYRPLVTFFEPDIYTFLPAKNPLNPTGERPLLIPVDSKRLLDPNYDPFEKYRTITFGLIIKAKFSKKPATMDGDLILPVFEQLLGKHPLSSQFVRMLFFAEKFHPRLVLNYTEVDVVLPTIYISYQKSIVLLKLIAQSEFLMHFNMVIFNREFSMSLDGPAFNVLINAYSNKLVNIDMKEMSLKIKSRETQFIAKSLVVDISSRVVNYVHLFKIELPKFGGKKVPVISSMPDINQVDELYTNFQKKIMMFIIPTITVRIFMTNINMQLQLILSGGKFELKGNQELAKLLDFSAEKISFFGVTGGLPLIEINSLQAYQGLSTNRILSLIQVADINSNLKSDDIDFFKITAPRLKSRINQIASILVPKKEAEPEPKKTEEIVTIKPENKQIASLANIVVKFIQDEGTSILTLKLGNINAKRSQKSDGSCITTFSWFKFEATHDLGLDQFKYIFQTNMLNPQSPFLRVKFTQPPLKMKFPVFDIFEICLTYYSIRISIPFIKEFKNFFPTAESISFLDLDQESESDEEEEDDLDIDHENSTIVENQANNERNTMLIRQFLFHHFDAEISLRRKTSGAFSEFLNRPLNFPKLHRYDIFGTQKQLLTFVRKTLTKAALMALPKMLFQKSRPIPLPPEQLVEQREMLLQQENIRKIEEMKQEEAKREREIEMKKLEWEKEKKQLEHKEKVMEMKLQQKQQKKEKYEKKLEFKQQKLQMKQEQKATKKQEAKLKQEQEDQLKQEKKEKKEQEAQQKLEKKEKSKEQLVTESETEREIHLDLNDDANLNSKKKEKKKEKQEKEAQSKLEQKEMKKKEKQVLEREIQLKQEQEDFEKEIQLKQEKERLEREAQLKQEQEDMKKKEKQEKKEEKKKKKKAKSKQLNDSDVVSSSDFSADMSADMSSENLSELAGSSSSEKKKLTKEEKAQRKKEKSDAKKAQRQEKKAKRKKEKMEKKLNGKQSTDSDLITDDSSAEISADISTESLSEMSGNTSSSSNEKKKLTKEEKAQKKKEKSEAKKAQKQEMKAKRAQEKKEKKEMKRKLRQEKLEESQKKKSLEKQEKEKRRKEKQDKGEDDDDEIREEESEEEDILHEELQTDETSDDREEESQDDSEEEDIDDDTDNDIEKDTQKVNKDTDNEISDSILVKSQKEDNNDELLVQEEEEEKK